MPLDDLHQFIALLESRAELKRIAVQVDPLLEIAAVTDTICKRPQGGPALLFEKPAGSRLRVATNLFGSSRRMCLALGLDTPEDLTGRLDRLLDQVQQPCLELLDRQIAAVSDFSRFSPRLMTSPAAEPDLVRQPRPDLEQFPFLQSWPGDGSADGFPRYVTMPLVFTAEPDGSNPNCGMYRAQVRGRSQLALAWRGESGAGRHCEAHLRQGRPMPVALALGGDPALTFSALCPLPGNLDEVSFAGFLRGSPRALVACRTVPLQVPAGCEVVIEGYVDPSETVQEGPFGNHTGRYAPATRASLLQVTAITHRREAIIPATVVGPPPMEDCWMAKAWERVLLSFLRRLIPGVREISFPLEWIFHQSAIISLDNPRAGVVRETAEALWRTPWFGSARLLIFVDASAGDAEPGAVAWQCINLAEFRDDLFFDSTGQRLALDATGLRRPGPRLAPDQGTLRLVSERWASYCLD